MLNTCHTVPIAVLGSVIVNSGLEFAHCLNLFFSVGNLANPHPLPIGLPFMQLCENSTESRPGGTTLCSIASLFAVAANAAEKCSAETFLDGCCGA